MIPLIVLAASTRAVAMPNFAFTGAAFSQAGQKGSGAAAKEEKLKITDKKVGTGTAVKQFDVVTVDYTGTLTNGKVFDSSLTAGRKPFELVVGIGAVIKGWDEGLIGMKVGGIRSLVIPPSLAYGARGAGDVIPPNSTINFDVTLRTIETPEKALTIKTETAGVGKPAKLGDKISFEFVACLKDGKVIADNNAPNPATDLTLEPSSIVEGMTLALVGMKAGEIRTVKIPAALGFGEDAHGMIPANSDLFVRIAMLSVKDEKAKVRPVIKAIIPAPADASGKAKGDTGAKTDSNGAGTQKESGNTDGKTGGNN